VRIERRRRLTRRISFCVLAVAGGAEPRGRRRCHPDQTTAWRIDEAVPAPVLSTALYERFSSRGEATFADKLLSAMRYEFGGHVEKSAG